MITYVVLAQAVACLVLIVSVLLLIWLSDHTTPKPEPEPEPEPQRGRHAHHRDSERFAETGDIPMDDVAWFRSLKEPRKPVRPFDWTRDVIPAPEYDPEYLPEPVYPTIFDPVVREDIVYAEPLTPLPEQPARPLPRFVPEAELDEESPWPVHQPWTEPMRAVPA